MAIKYVFAGIAVSDLEPALAWYTRLFERPADVLPNEREAMWQVASTGSIYLVADADRAGHSLLTLIVEDLERHVAELAERGLLTAEIETLPGVYRKAVIVDPDGNQIQFGQLLG